LSSDELDGILEDTDLEESDADGLVVDDSVDDIEEDLPIVYTEDAEDITTFDNDVDAQKLEVIEDDIEESADEVPSVSMQKHEELKDETRSIEIDNLDENTLVIEENLDEQSLNIISDGEETTSSSIEEPSEISNEVDETKSDSSDLTPNREQLRDVIGYLDNLLGELPKDVIEKFAQSDYFNLYQKIMDDLGL